MAAKAEFDRTLLAATAFAALASIATPSASGHLIGDARVTLEAHREPYGWPVKPFDRAHPIRGNFGDPRTVFAGPPAHATIYGGDGLFAFHAGVDIVAPDGTPVYAVRSGVVTHSGAAKVFVYSGHRVSHGYWHIDPEVRKGERVVAHRTILGRIARGASHVHFTERRDGRAVNPLAPGHLSPYDDHRAPRIGALELRGPEATDKPPPELAGGRVELVARAYDAPALPAPGRWATMPIVPAIVTWRVVRARDGAVVVRERTAFDVRATVPPRRDFWRVFARGTRQNMATFRKRRWRQPGVYSFRLGLLEAHRHADGLYRLVVTARDIRDNRATAAATFVIVDGRVERR